ncbi:hypothetical protein SELMODRAFT_71859, partial [Selaginella moellendorffii]
NSMIAAYARLGSIEETQRLFDQMPVKDMVSWTTLISLYAQKGDLTKAKLLSIATQAFRSMEMEGIELNPAAFSKILAGCSHAGLISESLSYFSSMGENYDMVASKEHYCSLVDALGRSGKLGEARDLIDNMPFIADVVVCGSLLASCERSSNLNVGRDIAKNILSIDPRNGSSCVALANTIAQ